MSLSNLAITVGDLGRDEDALTIIQEAVSHYRALADAQPEAFLPQLAGSLNNLANRLAELDQYEDALTAIQEAVSHYRALADTQPDAFLAQLAESLNNLAVRLAELDQYEDALSTIQEAAIIWQHLGGPQSDALLPQLANTLTIASWIALGKGDVRITIQYLLAAMELAAVTNDEEQRQLLVGMLVAEYQRAPEQFNEAWWQQTGEKLPVWLSPGSSTLDDTK
jgi:tetratricopeptide (TPR) repeat protein